MSSERSQSREQKGLRRGLVQLARTAFASRAERTIQRSNSDPAAVNLLFSKAGKRLYYEHIPETKGQILTVRFPREDEDELTGD